MADHASRTPPSPCIIVGNSDFYGLGIRLGAYLQWFTSILAYNCSIIEASSMRGVNTCFQLATVAGLIGITVQHRQDVHAIDVFLLIMLALGASCDYCTRPSPKAADRSEAEMRGSWWIEAVGSNSVTDLVRMSVAAAVCAYGAWFTFKGIDGLKRRSCGDHGFIFIFAKVRLDGNYRVFIKFVFVVGLVLFSIVVLISAYLIYGRYLLLWRRWWDPDNRESQVENETECVRPSKAKVVIAMTAFVFFIVTIEVTLIWSDVQEVHFCNSFSQLFPLIIGVSNMLRLLYKLGIDIWRGKLRFT
ncbi:hypothetical protein K469DRAFT_648594 [Zopfia rhizophila CBS 207.26]|uniref:Uncharacterized protein n=1 Tax=Zopfia rhizophila CBS 207.26 TaxID=1314779 RepID=A0A6A6ETY6_9PEZI|nr:hypothetical protein K469DRAFT_648594 [Zopfia rhizophila CBS 207.26]